MPSPSSLEALRTRKAALLAQILHLPEFRFGSLLGRYRKCGKPQCHCASDGSLGHGPSWALTWKSEGRTATKMISAENVQTIQEQLAAHHRFQELVHELVETNTQICDALLASKSEEEGGPEGAKKRGLQEAVAREVDRELKELVEQLTHRKGDAAVSFERVEAVARSQALEVACRVIEATFNADCSDGAQSVQPCPCGGQARYAGRRPRTVVSVVGEMTLARAYYCCARCGHGFCPRDQQLQIGWGSLSTGVLRMVGLTAALVSFKESDELLEALAGVRVGAKEVERASEALGGAIAEDERSIVSPQAPPSGTMYLGLDGTGVPMRPEELRGRVGKQPDGSSKTREVKLATIWTADRRDPEGKVVRDEGSVSYNAAIESAATADTAEQLSAFAHRVEREATRRGFAHADRQVIVADAAKWIWKLSEELFPHAIEVLDLYHAKGTLSEVAKAIFGAESELGRTWATLRHDEIDAGDIDAVLEALHLHADRKEAVTCCEYLRSNRHRMRYPEFRRAGLCVSSGVVEAGCKLAIGTRLKRAGMHWTLRGANAIIALRCCKLSGRSDDYWKRRAAG